MAFWVSARLPATSTKLSVIGEVGSGSDCARARKLTAIEPARPPTTTARRVIPNVMRGAPHVVVFVIVGLSLTFARPDRCEFGRTRRAHAVPARRSQRGKPSNASLYRLIVPAGPVGLALG